MKKGIIYLMLILFVATNNYANPSENIGLNASMLVKKKKKQSGFDKTRLLVGPGFGVGAGFRSFSFNISPSIAYCFTDNFHVGTTIGFNYFQQGIDVYNPYTLANEKFKYKIPAYSFSVFARYIIMNRFILNFEPEINNTKYYTTSVYIDNVSRKPTADFYRTSISSVLAGIGYVQKFNQLGYSFVMLNYDLLQNPNAVRYYQTIDFRVGIMFTLFNN